MPTPASESPDALGSPVPAYSVFPLASFGSRSIVPTAFEGKPFETNTQDGSGENGLSVRQIRPPAAATQSRQFEFVVQTGVFTIDVTRPAMWNSAPEKLRIPGCVACVGPISDHSNGLFVLFALPVYCLFSPYVAHVFEATCAAFAGIVPVGSAWRRNLSIAGPLT